MPSPILKRYAALDRIATGYRASQVLFTAVRLGVFAALGSRGMTARGLARRLRTDPRATRILADALAGLGLLRKRAGWYCNSALAREFLVPTAPCSQQALLLHGAALYQRWAKLTEVVRSGRPVPGRTDPRTFAHAMASSAALWATETAAALDLAGVRTMLDVGGGPGLYAVACARRQPRLRVVVLDSAPTLQVARRYIAQAGLADRIELRAGDALCDPLGGPYDLVLLSNVIHSYSAAENRRLLARLTRVLAPGGRVAIKDFFLGPDRTRPLAASLFAVNMLVNTERGDCYTVAEVRQWLRAAGLRFAGVARLSPPSQVVFGRK